MCQEVFVPLQVDDSLFVVLRDHGDIVGYYPVDRTPSMPRFTRDDEMFLKLAAPHIACGLKAALSVLNNGMESGEFAKFDGNHGVVLLGANGHILGLDNNARSIFQRMGALDDRPSDMFAANNVKRVLAYIACILRSVLFENGDASFNLPAPVARIYSHRNGIALKLRGFPAAGESTRYITVIVEQGETEDARAFSSSFCRLVGVCCAVCVMACSFRG